MTPFLLVLAVLCAQDLVSATTAPTINDCDEDIIRKIKEQWSDNPPEGLLKEGKENGLEMVIKSTEGYFNEDTKCSESLFVGNYLVMVRVNKKGEPTTSISPVAESKGTLYNPKTKIVRYFLYKSDSVCGVYVCKQGGPKGNPQGFIKVAKCGFNKAEVTLAENTLKEYGMEMKDDFEGKCD